MTSLLKVILKYMLLQHLFYGANPHSIMGENAGHSEFEYAARRGIIKDLSSVSSGHLIVIGLKGAEVYLVRDGEKVLVSGDEFKPSRHSATLTDEELQAIPYAPHNKSHRHISPLLCATVISSNVSIDRLNHNVKVSSRYCDWAVVTTGQLFTKIPSTSPIILMSKMAESELQHLGTSVLYQSLYNVSSVYHRIWLIDEHVSLVEEDIARFLTTWELSFWPHPAPLIAHPLISSSSSTPFPFTSVDFWPSKSRLPNRKPVIAVEVDFLPTTAIAMETNFFRWFGTYFVQLMIDSKCLVTAQQLSSILCKSASVFGYFKSIKYPCVLVVDSYLENAPNEKSSFEESSMKCIKDAFPVWFDFPYDKKSMKGVYNRDESRMVISNDFESVYKTRATSYMGELKTNTTQSPPVAVHVTRIANNAFKTHRASHLGTKIHASSVSAPLTASVYCDPPLYASASPKPTASTNLVAFYFPQFHRDSYNEKLWGDGFTDWVNIFNKPSFNRLGIPVLEPSELGWYNLTDKKSRQLQACLAKTYGVDAFAYHHYWFYDGKNLSAISGPLEALLKDGEPNLPFMLHWANHPWTNTWSGDGEETILIDQIYPEAESDLIKEHYEFLRRFFKHKNYILVNGSPVFMIYMAFRTGNLPGILRRLIDLAKNDGFSGLHLVRSTGEVLHPTEVKQNEAGKNRGITLWSDRDSFYDADLFYPSAPESSNVINSRRIPVQCIKGDHTKRNRPHYVGLVTSFDNLPRRSFHSSIFAHRAPIFPVGEVDLYVRDLANSIFFEMCCQSANDRENGGKFVFLNAWNEWGEGMAIEPSNLYGRAYLDAIRLVVSKFNDKVRQIESNITICASIVQSVQDHYDKNTKDKIEDFVDIWPFTLTDD